MYSRLWIRNFRGIRDLDIDGLAPVTVLSGLNSAGKSTVLEALFLHAAGPFAGQAGATTLRGFRGEAGLHLDGGGRSSPWDELFFDMDSAAGIQLDADGVKVTASVAPGRAATFSDGPTGSTVFSSSLDVRVEANGDEWPYLQSITAVPAPAGPGVLPGINLQFDLQPPAVRPLHPAHLVSQRTRTSAPELCQRFTRLKQAGRDHEMLQALRILEPNLKALEILTPSGQPVLHARTGDGPSLPLSVMGEGLGAVAEIISTILEPDVELVLVDEIENGIHHSRLGELWSTVMRLAETTSVQVVATTHSEECLQAAFDASRSRPPLLTLLRLTADRRGRGTVRATTYQRDSLGLALDERLDVR